jgi:hypothetical protein
MDDLHQFGYITKLKIIIIMVIITIPKVGIVVKPSFTGEVSPKNEI